MSPGLVVSNSIVSGPLLKMITSICYDIMSHMLDHSKEIFIPPHNIFGKEVESTGGVVARIVEPRCVRGGGLVVNPCKRKLKNPSVRPTWGNCLRNALSLGSPRWGTWSGPENDVHRDYPSSETLQMLFVVFILVQKLCKCCPSWLS